MASTHRFIDEYFEDMANATYTVERSALISAPPQKVYDLLADFHHWPLWSPWEELDPGMERTHSGAESGVGAKYAWSGNRKAGKGDMTITGATAPSQILIALNFLKPFKSSNTTTFTLTPEGDGTKVLWSMTGPRPLLMRLFGFVFNMEKLVGKDFEKGLAKLKQIAAES
jgi:uncharacterized protein YndB with AHSA1/START domain